jgi:hypothetical protein
MSTTALAAEDTSHVDDILGQIRARVNKEVLEDQIDQFIDIISSDGFLDYVNGIAELPTFSERRLHTIETANVETLRSLNVPTPEGLRLTTREFELPEDGVAVGTPLVQIRPGTDPRMGWCVSLGFYLCASFGG